MTGKRKAKVLHFDEELWQRIEAFRFAAKCRTDAEAVRVLIRLGIAAWRAEERGQKEGVNAE
jgi:hypothetical protein